MPSDYESGIRKTIDLSVKAEKITSDILVSAMQEFLNGNAEKKGRMTFRQLEDKSQSKLENIEITENNISSFLDTARKYYVDYALRRDKSTQPPTYHVFFSAGKADNFKKAFSEYADKMQGKIASHGEMSREQLKKSAQKAAEKPCRKEKQREKSRENMH